MRTIMLTILAASVGGGTVFLAMRALDSSPAEVDLAPIMAELERRIDERVGQHRQADEPDAPRDEPEQREDTPDPRDADDALVDAVDADASPAVIEVRASDDLDALDAAFGTAPTLEPTDASPSFEPIPQSSNAPADADAPAADDLEVQQQTRAPATERPDYRQLSEGLVEAASALERFNQTLSGSRDASQQQQQDAGEVEDTDDTERPHDGEEVGDTDDAGDTGDTQRSAGR